MFKSAETINVASQPFSLSATCAMTAIASAHPTAGRSNSGQRTTSYSHAHWYFLAAFLVIVAGFWPTFFRSGGSGTVRRNLHGVTSSLWYVALILQSWLMSRGQVRAHRRVAIGIAVLLPMLCVSALSNTRVLLSVSDVLPPPVRPLIAFIDFQLVLQMVVLVTLGILNRRTPAAHKRFMAATALVGFAPALARLYANLGIDRLGPINGPLLTVDVILLVLIAVDRRNGERRTAYPLLLVWNAAIQLLIVPLSASAGWLAFCAWFAAPVPGMR